MNSSGSFDGDSDMVNIYSSNLASDLDGDEGSFSAWLKVSGAGIWTDGSTNFVNPNTDPLVSSDGLHFAVGVFYPQNVNDDKDSLWSIDSSRDYAVSARSISVRSYLMSIHLQKSCWMV